MRINLDTVIKNIESGALNHAFNAPLSCGKFSAVLSISTTLAALANVMFAGYGTDGADQIPITPVNMNEALAASTSVGVNAYLSVYLTCKFFIAIENYFHVYRLSKKIGSPLTPTKLVKDGLHTGVSLTFATVAATVLYNLSAGQVASWISVITLIDNTIQYFFGAQTFTDQIINFSQWFVQKCKPSCSTNETDNQTYNHLPATTAPTITAGKALEKLEKLKEELLDRDEKNLVEGYSYNASYYISDYLNTPIPPEEKTELQLAIESDIKTLSNAFHFIMQAIQALSNVGYWYSSAQNDYVGGSFAFIPFAVLSIKFTYDTTNDIIKLFTKKKSNRASRFPSAKYDSCCSKALDTLFSYEALFLLIKTFGYFASYYSSAASLDFNKKTPWAWASSTFMQVVTCMGVMTFNGFSVMDTVKMWDEHRRTKTFSPKRQQTIYAVNKFIAYLKVRDAHDAVELLPFSAQNHV